ncbi:HNH endonuclease [Aquimarina sp. D1M17]|uniref:HNH endonuclease n=1 Tax=Aquimarina acroporae TaxID=2937283 RepID=UPI0020BE6DA9|nr:HNH endonuclease [Aquimarina acroporae]MCK8521475.1 HNH endonuclease [Aquimarina acroporae]
MYYWVNQGKTYKEEKEGGYLWAPTHNSSGNSVFHWDNMTKLNPNDIVLNYYKGYLIGYCIIASEYFLASQPKEFNVDVEWQTKGYMIDAKYFLFSTPLDINKVYSKIEQYLPSKYAPLNKTGNPSKIKANQGYLYKLNWDIVKVIFDLARVRLDDYTKPIQTVNEEASKYNTPKQTTRESLVISRTCQGEFRQQILKRWDYKCAVNGVTIKEILIASHIVPWRESSDQERIDVDNGLLLSPTYDALFDRCLISFDDDGQILLSGSMNRNNFSKLGITGKEKINNLTEGNKKYLKRHREKLVNL